MPTPPVQSMVSPPGASYGVDGIPARWRDKIALSEQILDLADGLLTFSGHDREPELQQ